VILRCIECGTPTDSFVNDEECLICGGKLEIDLKRETMAYQRKVFSGD